MKTSHILRWLSAILSSLLFLATAQAQTIVYNTTLTGPNEFPPNASPGTGFAEVGVNLVTHVLTVHADFSGLTGTTTAAHVHAPTDAARSGTAGVATETPYFSGFPIGVTSGTFDGIFDMTQSQTWNPSYVTANGGTNAGAEAAFAQALADGKAYFNIHSTTFPGGEIRGFLVLVPEPGTIGLFAIGGLGLFLFAARKARRN
jgi:hypothetical protein